MYAFPLYSAEVWVVMVAAYSSKVQTLM